jgi:hypothetical protein
MEVLSRGVPVIEVAERLLLCETAYSEDRPSL